MKGQKGLENTDKALKYGIYRHLPTYEKIIRNLVSFYNKNGMAGDCCTNGRQIKIPCKHPYPPYLNHTR